MSKQRSSIAEIMRGLIRQAMEEEPVQISDAEFAAQQAEHTRRQEEYAARIRREEEGILRRSGLRDMETFRRLTAPSPRDLFVLEMRTTPERWLMDNPDSVDIFESFGLKRPRIGDDVPLSAREQFILAHRQTPEAHAFTNPERHPQAMAEFLGEGESIYTNDRLS